MPARAQSGDVDLPVSDHLAQRRQRKQRDDDGRLVSVDDPHGVGGADSQFGRERGQRDVGDGAVDDGQPHAECDGEDGPQTPGHGQPVAKGGGIGLRRGGKHAAKVTKKRRPGNLRVPVGRDFSVRVSLRRRRMSRASAYPVRAARGYTGRVMTPDRMKQNYDIFSKNNDLLLKIDNFFTFGRRSSSGLRRPAAAAIRRIRRRRTLRNPGTEPVRRPSRMRRLPSAAAQRRGRERRSLLLGRNEFVEQVAAADQPRGADGAQGSLRNR